jgi:hypothetical protein
MPRCPILKSDGLPSLRLDALLMVRMVLPLLVMLVVRLLGVHRADRPGLSRGNKERKRKGECYQSKQFLHGISYFIFNFQSLTPDCEIIFT